MGDRRMREELGLGKLSLDSLTHYFDPSLLDRNRSGDGGSASARGGSYVVVRDGGIETVVTGPDGNSTKIRIDAVDAEAFLDYLLSQGKITVAQRNAYGETQSLELSLKDVKDAAQFFDWTYSTTDGIELAIDPEATGISPEDINYIREELLPLLKFGE